MDASQGEDPHRKAFRDARQRFEPDEREEDPFAQLLERLHAAECAETGRQNAFINDNRK